MILLEIILIIFFVYIIILLSYSMLRGAPYAPIGKKRMDTMFELLNANSGKLLDLGSGDGRIVVEAAKRGLEAYGYEINPLLAVIAKLKIKQNKQTTAQIFIKDYWKENFSEFDYVTIYGTTRMLKFLELKLLKELKPGAKVISNHFKFPNWKYTRKKNDVYLYVKN